MNPLPAFFDSIGEAVVVLIQSPVSALKSSICLIANTQRGKAGPETRLISFVRRTIVRF
jgi:hypothetical protein